MYHLSHLASSIMLVIFLLVPVCSFAGELPESWHPFGEAEFNWTDETTRTGRRAACVECAALGELAGWSQMIAVRPDREYVFSVWAKSDRLSVAPGGRGAVAAIVFLDANREPFAEPVMAPLQRNLQQWTELKTPPARAPQGAFFARLVAGIHQAQGRVWFDDVRLDTQPIAGAAEPNLVSNGSFDTVEDGVLAGWYTDNRQPIRQRADTVAGEGKSVDHVVTDDGHALRLAVDRRGHERGIEPNIMVPNATLSTDVQPQFGYTPDWWGGFPGHVPVLAGSRYEMSFRYRPFWQTGEGGVNRYLFLDIHFRGPITDNWHHSAALIGGLRENIHFGNGQGDWHTKRLSFTVAEGVERCFLTFGMSTWTAQSHHGWVLIDDVQVLPLDPELANVSFERSASVPELVITREQVKELFGDKPAWMIIHYPGDHAPPKGGVSGPIYYVDFQDEPLELKVLVDDAHGRNDTDPFISPDGTRVVYSTEDGIYVVRITPGGADRTLVAENGYDHRWWVHPVTGDEFIIYVDTPCGTEDSIEGKTYLQQIERGGCRPIGQPKVLISDYAFRGGRTPCGRYTCTALPGKAFAELKPHAIEDAFVEILYSDRRMCNPSISQDPAHPTRWLWLNEAHNMISVFDADKHVMTIHVPPGQQYGNLQWGEWSTHPDFITASPCSRNDDSTPRLHDAWIYQWSTKKWTQVTRRAGTTHLWVERPADQQQPHTDGAVQTDDTENATPRTPAQAWPHQEQGLLLAWRDGNTRPIARSAAGEPLFKTFWRPQPVGLAMFDGDFTLRLEGGAFVAAEIAEPVAEAIRKANALTLQLTIEPAQQEAQQPAAVIQLGRPDAAVPFALVQNGRQLELRLASPLVAAPGANITLMPLDTDEATHAAVVIEGKRATFYRDGKPAGGQTIESLDLSQWPATAISIGSGARDEGWYGRISGVALHAAALSTESILSDAEHLAAEKRARQPVELLIVDAKLVEASETPAPADTAYNRGYSVHAWELTRVVSGKFEGKRVRVAHWTEMDELPLEPAHYTKGEIRRLVLEPFEAHPELDQEQVFDTLPLDVDEPVFFDAGPIRIYNRQ